jgi:hypothetical protein
MNWCKIFFLVGCFYTMSSFCFTIQGTQIKDANGNTFIPIGANVTVDNFYDWKPFLDEPGAVESFTEQWKFNTARANLVIGESIWGGTVFGTGWLADSARTRQRLDDLINTLTPKGVVVMLEVHDWTGSYPSSQNDFKNIRDFWNWAAQRYQTNPYVWFNLWNEPGWESPVSPQYRDINQKLISMIRDTLSSENIIVIDGAAFGQEAYSWNDNPVWEGNSGILTYGPDLINFNEKTYSNILFSIHLYDQWGPNDSGSPYWNKFRQYISAVHAKGLALIIGEVGAPSETNFIGTTEMAYQAGLIENQIGMLAWHWDPRDGFRLIDGPNQYAGYHLNDFNPPSNLSSWMGEYFWKATHEDGYGLQEEPPVSMLNRNPAHLGIKSQTLLQNSSTGDVYIQKGADRYKLNGQLMGK